MILEVVCSSVAIISLSIRIFRLACVVKTDVLVLLLLDYMLALTILPHVKPVIVLIIVRRVIEIHRLILIHLRLLLLLHIVPLTLVI